MKTLDKVLIAVGIFLAVFIIATVIIYTANGWPYDVLIPCVLGSGLLETVNTMIITVNKIRRGEDDVDDIGDRSSIPPSMYDLGNNCSGDAGEGLEENI